MDQPRILATVTLGLMVVMMVGKASPLRAESRTTYRVVPDKSRLWFTGKSTLHDFTGSTRNLRCTVTGIFTAEDASRSLSDLKGASGRIAFAARSMKTGNESRDETMYERLRVNRHPEISLAIDSVTRVSTSPHVEGVRAWIKGRVQAAGETRTIQPRVTLESVSPDGLKVQSSFPLKMSDFGIEPPSFLYFVQTEDRIKVHVDLQLVRQKKPDSLTSRKPSQREDSP